MPSGETSKKILRHRPGRVLMLIMVKLLLVLKSLFQACHEISANTLTTYLNHYQSLLMLRNTTHFYKNKETFQKYMNQINVVVFCLFVVVFVFCIQTTSIIFYDHHLPIVLVICNSNWQNLCLFSVYPSSTIGNLCMFTYQLLQETELSGFKLALQVLWHD